MQATSVLIVDDHPLMREGLCRWIAAEPGIRVAGKAGSVQVALSFVESETPDLIITDLSLPGRNGLELIKDMAVAHPEIPIIVLSMHDELVYAERVLRAGGRGYVMKDAPLERLIEAIHTVLDGGIFASQIVTSHFLKALSPVKGKSGLSFPLERLTDREIEVFELIGRAKGSHEIAAQLGISVRTLDAHRTHIRQKLGHADSSELTRHAIRWVEVGMIGR